MTLPRPRSDRLASVESSSITNHPSDLPVMTSSISAYNTTQDIWTPMIHNGSLASSSLRSESPAANNVISAANNGILAGNNIIMSPIQQLDQYQLERNPRYSSPLLHDRPAGARVAPSFTCRSWGGWGQPGAVSGHRGPRGPHSPQFAPSTAVAITAIEQ